ncbi:MAG: S24/S26 family peptidase [Lachnospiraceae bacterium]|nr:S24/S26 family peptidase [Lachnospiraceae bacterium]MCD7841504.1 S24/S26 family peptidase [Lachnospiraceae bacterium]
MAEQKVDIEQLLAEGRSIQIKPQGTSMFPLFLEGRDEAVIAPLTESGRASLRCGDVVLYRRDHGILVLHRISRCTSKGFYLVGDHQSELEGPIRGDQIRGILTGFIRSGKYCSVRHPVYILASRCWLVLRPLRPGILWFLHWVKDYFRKSSSDR